MSAGLFFAFVAATIFLGLTPGPNMSLIIANTLSGGLRAGLLTLAGTTTGLALLTLVATLGMSSLMVLMADWFDVVRWVGAVYLIFLGLRQLRGWWLRRGSAAPLPPPHPGAAYAHGFIVSISNPKVLLFLGAFFPQFVDPAADPVLQLAILAVTFLLVLLIVDILYTVALARARSVFDQRRLVVMDGIAGGLLVVGGLVLATARRPV
jgi:threonine/homoserine/homoserine lactone efflux protein